MAEMLERMWDDALWKLKLAAELEQSRRGPKPAAQEKEKVRIYEISAVLRGSQHSDRSRS